MGPLLPLAMLVGGLWYLDDKKSAAENPNPRVGAAPRYSSTAIAAVTETRGGTRFFKAAPSVDLGMCSLEHIDIETRPADIAMFKLLTHVEMGSLPANKAVEQAVAKGLFVLASMSVILSEPGTQPMLLAFVPAGAVERYTGASSHFAVLAAPAAPAAEAESPKKRVRNGFVKTEPEVLAEMPAEKAEA